MNKLFLILLLLLSLGAFASEERIEDDLIQMNCSVQQVWSGRYLNWCPLNSVVTRVEVIPSFNPRFRPSVWVDCASLRAVCLKESDERILP